MGAAGAAGALAGVGMAAATGVAASAVRVAAAAPPEVSPEADVIYAAYRNYPYMTRALAQRIVEVAANLDTNPYLLANVLRAESQFSPRAQNAPGEAWEVDDRGRATIARFNPGNTATGLLQFLSSSAAAVGTTPWALFNMSAVQQMAYVEKYLAQYMPLDSKQALYIAVFQPNDPARYGDPDTPFESASARAQYPTPQHYMDFVDAHAMLNEDGSPRAGSKYGYFKPPSPEIAAEERAEGRPVAAARIAGASRIVIGRLANESRYRLV